MTTTMASSGLVVETGEQRVGVPLLGTFACRFRKGILRLHGVVDDDKVAAAAGERPADRGRHTVASERGRELQFGILCRADPSVRKQPVYTKSIASPRGSRWRVCGPILPNS